MTFDHQKQDLLDRLTSTARLTADACDRAANLHLGGHFTRDNQYIARLREDIAAHLNLLHDLLPENFQ